MRRRFFSAAGRFRGPRGWKRGSASGPVSRCRSRSAVICCPTLADLLEQFLPARPCLVTSLLVRAGGIWLIAGAHESVAGAVVGHGLESLARLFHLLLALGDRAGHPGVIAAVEAVHRAFNFGDRGFLFRTRAIKDEGGLDRFGIRGV